MEVFLTNLRSLQAQSIPEILTCYLFHYLALCCQHGACISIYFWQFHDVSCCMSCIHKQIIKPPESWNNAPICFASLTCTQIALSSELFVYMLKMHSLSLFTFMHWRRKWQPTPVFLLGESQGRRSLVGSYLWGRTESDMTEVTQQQQQLSS